MEREIDALVYKVSGLTGDEISVVNEKRSFYLAYGSNMNKEQMSARCPNAEPVGKTYIAGWKLVFHHYANIEPSDGSRTPAFVWKITAADEASLDRYEGYPKSYTKTKIGVAVNAKTIETMAYIMTDWKKEKYKNHPPDENYFNLIKQGYIDSEFSENELETVKSTN